MSKSRWKRVEWLIEGTSESEMGESGRGQEVHFGVEFFRKGEVAQGIRQMTVMRGFDEEAGTVPLKLARGSWLPNRCLV